MARAHLPPHPAPRSGKTGVLGRLNFAGENDLRQLQKLSTPVWIFDVDRHGVWWANPQGLAFWKSSSVEELQQRDFASDSTTVRERLRQIVELASTDSHITDTWTLYPDDEPQTVILSFQPVEIEGKFKGILIELVQVLDRSADDETWRLLEATRATSLIMTSFSMDGQLLAQNPASLACYGTAQAQSGQGSDLALRFVNAEDAANVLEKARNNETATWEAEVATSAGVRIHSIAVRMGRDPITGDFVTVLSEEDVTERAELRRLQEREKEALKSKVAESSDQLRISRERYELAVQTASIWDYDVAADRLFMSPNFVKSLGYQPEEFKDLLRENRIYGVIHPEDRATYEREITRHLAAPGSALSHELRFIAKSGEVLWYHCQGMCVCDEEGNVTRSAGLLTDITGRKNLEASLLVSQRMEAIGQLTGGIAHDFNNLLTVIQGNAELLAELSSDADKELTTEIVRAVRRGADLTTHLLAFAKQQTLIPKAINLNQLIPDMEKTLLRAVSETVSIEFSQTEGLWDVYADPAQLETAILNLAFNARDAMPAGGKLKITCTNREHDAIPDVANMELSRAQYVEIAVSDTGFGMSQDELRKAFEPFFTTKGVGQGSGLGLSMVLGFSRQSHGDARITSAPDQGTQVTFYLPRSDIRAEADLVRRPDAPSQGNSELVHVLEDNAQVQQTVSRMVSALGYKVTTSSDAEEALNWAAQHPDTDLYLVDIVLPGGKSGVDFARQLHKHQPEAKVLFMSGYSEGQVNDIDHMASDVCFISKPFDTVAFSRAIGSALKGREQVSADGIR